MFSSAGGGGGVTQNWKKNSKRITPNTQTNLQPLSRQLTNELLVKIEHLDNNPTTFVVGKCTQFVREEQYFLLSSIIRLLWTVQFYMIMICLLGSYHLLLIIRLIHIWLNMNTNLRMLVRRIVVFYHPLRVIHPLRCILVYKENLYNS